MVPSIITGANEMQSRPLPAAVQALLGRAGAAWRLALHLVGRDATAEPESIEQQARALAVPRRTLQRWRALLVRLGLIRIWYRGRIAVLELATALRTVPEPVEMELTASQASGNPRKWPMCATI